MKTLQNKTKNETRPKIEIEKFLSHLATREKVSSSTETCKAIYAVWQPKSEYELVKAPDFEYYDERFNPDKPEVSELDLYIPVKREG